MHNCLLFFNKFVCASFICGQLFLPVEVQALNNRRSLNEVVAPLVIGVLCQYVYLTSNL